MIAQFEYQQYKTYFVYVTSMTGIYIARIECYFLLAVKRK